MEAQRRDGDLGVESRPDAVIARFTREVILSGQEAEAAAEGLTAVLADVRQRPLLIDFANVKSLSSLMLGKLTLLNRAANAAGVRMALFSLRPEVREILEVTGLHFVVCLYDCESDALMGS